MPESAYRSLLSLIALVAVLGSLLPARMAPAQSLQEFACPGEDFEPPAAAAVIERQTGELPYRLVVPGLASDGAARAPEPALLALEERLVAIVGAANTSGRFAVAVTDLQTGETIGVGLDRPQLAGCVMNFFAIVAALRAVDAGQLALADVDATIRQTLWASDATAARLLYRATGGGDILAGVHAVNALLQELGMTSSLVDHPPAFPNESIGIDPDNWLTARDVNRGLARFYAGEVLSAGLTSYLLEAMTQVKPGLNYLTAIMAGPAVVSHKNGFLWVPEGYVDNDAAIVRFGPNLEHAYAITFLSEAVPVKYADIPTGQALVRETWDYFRDSYD
ncbi:MAG: serine hydrolase [Dehalococcoidia bacterium]|nr:serine hydrolase [Dehalococcoidia bacterium]